MSPLILALIILALILLQGIGLYLIMKRQARTNGELAPKDDGTARLLAGLGLAAGVIGAGIGLYGLTRRRPA